MLEKLSAPELIGFQERLTRGGQMSWGLWGVPEKQEKRMLKEQENVKRMATCG